MTRFLLDASLERLARDLRMLGFDALVQDETSHEELAALAEAEGRALLADTVQAKGKAEQLREVLERYSLVETAREGKGFLTRCLQCNSTILPAHPHQVAHLVSGDILTRFDHFFFCPRCERAYWKGSHWDRMRKWTQDVLSS